MDGIMVLNTIATPVYSFGWNNWCLLLILPIILAIYLIWFWYVNRDLYRARKWRTIGLALLIGSLALGTTVCANQNVREEYTYQVILNNDADMEWFRDTYEVVKQVGITYMVKHK